MTNSQRAQLIYDYTVLGLPASRSGDKIDMPERCQKDGLIGKYGTKFNVTHSEILSILNDAGIDTSHSGWGKEKIADAFLRNTVKK